ncbi:MAG: DNA alkylation repair protein [Clostridia bacterium]|nr:DNA alkylation repair protein [Clostridia bacterium]
MSELRLNADEKFKDFNAKIVAGEKPMIGVRTPVIHKIAKEVAKEFPYEYLSDCKFAYYEDTLVYGLVIATFPFGEFSRCLPAYLSNADNWAHIDLFASKIKCVKKERDKFFGMIKNDIFTAEGFYLRFLLVALLDYFVTEENLPFIFSAAKASDGKGYYNDMAIAWLLSACYIAFPEETYAFLSEKSLGDFTHNKTISKISDSYRVSDEDKIKIKKLRKT